MTTEKHQRRQRYSGKNPRHFSEKYKEHDSERYSADVAKVVASGMTPAGTHRPVMVREVMEVLAPRAGELAVAMRSRFSQPSSRAAGSLVSMSIPSNCRRLKRACASLDLVRMSLQHTGRTMPL